MKQKWRILLSLLLSLCFFSGCSASFSDVVIARIDGEEIMQSEYMVYLYTTTKSFVEAAGEDVWNLDFDGMSAEELVQERAFSTIQSVIAAKKYAKENNISLTQEQITEAHQSAEEFKAKVSPEDWEKMNVTEKQLQALMEESYLYSVVYDTLAAECEVNPKEMENYYTENADSIREGYTQITIDTIMLDDLQTAEEVAARAQAGEDFDALFAAYDVDDAAKESEHGGAMTLYQNYLKIQFGITQPLEVGQITDAVQADTHYFVLKVKAITPPTEEEVRAQAEKDYQDMVQSAYAEERIASLIDMQEVEKIPEAWENMESFR